MKSQLLTALSLLSLACTASAENLCVLDNSKDVSKCQPGDSIYFERADFAFGSLTPSEFVAQYCDINKQIVTPWGGKSVFCVLSDPKTVNNVAGNGAFPKTEQEKEKK